MMSEKLLPCPFCGSEQVTTAPDREFGDVTWIAMCKACGGGVEQYLEEHAIIAWNTRAAMQADAAPVVARVSTSNPVVDHETGNTSDKLRDALEVWRDASEAYSYPVTDEYGYLFAPEERADRAAAVIEADRQATRAALVAEIVEWLRKRSRETLTSQWHCAFVAAADEIEVKWSKL